MKIGFQKGLAENYFNILQVRISVRNKSLFRASHLTTYLKHGTTRIHTWYFVHCTVVCRPSTLDYSAKALKAKIPPNTLRT